MADFNGDGFADLVVGAPGEAPGDDPQSGAIYTLLGTSGGLIAGSDFDQESLNLGRNEAGDAFGEALAVGDFNNDGFDDIAVGAPGESPGDDLNSGAVFTLRGSSEGLVRDRDLDQEALDLGNNEIDDSFGEALAVGDFNGDGFDDLAVGAPGESPGGDPASGVVFTLRGSSQGLVADTDIDQENRDLGSNEFNDAFGEALAVGDFNNDGFDDLAVGAPGEAPGDDPASGAVFTLLGSAGGLVEGDDYDQDNTDLGRNEFGDSFGEALAVGDFNGDGFDDVAVGAPGEAPGDDPASGAVFTLLGSDGGLVRGQDFDQDNLDLGTNELNNFFGEALAVGDFNNDGFDDLVVGAPGEAPGDDPASGAIYILRGSSTGLVAEAEEDQESLGLGTNEEGDLFGAALTVGDFDSDGFDDVAVGAPGEAPGDDPASGAIYILRGSSDGLVASEDFDQENLGLGTNEGNNLFGVALASSRDENEPTPPIVTPDPLPEGQVGLYRFRNTAFDTGAYLFVGEAERDNILSDPNLRNSFALEGNGDRAFVANSQPSDDTIPLYRLRSVDTAGTYLFVSTEEYNEIFAEDSNQRNKWIKEGLDSEGGDIPEFYVYGAGADRGTEFHRFQNQANNTYLYAGEAETAAINSDPNLSNLFLDQGVAFESV